jgi:hypothetical protein
MAFSLAILTDRVPTAHGASSVRDKYLSNLEARSQAELTSVVSSLRLTVNQLATELHTIVLNLLKKVRTALGCHRRQCTPREPNGLLTARQEPLAGWLPMCPS